MDEEHFEHIAIIWSSRNNRFFNDLCKEVQKAKHEKQESNAFYKHWVLIGNEQKLARIDFTTIERIILLADLDWQKYNLMDCYGLKVLLNIFTERNIFLPSLICSFLSEEKLEKTNPIYSKLAKFTTFRQLPCNFTTSSLNFLSKEDTVKRYLENLYETNFKYYHGQGRNLTTPGIINQIKQTINDQTKFGYAKLFWDKIKMPLFNLEQFYKNCDLQNNLISVEPRERAQFYQSCSAVNGYFKKGKTEENLSLKIDCIKEHLNLLKQKLK